MEINTLLVKSHQLCRNGEDREQEYIFVRNRYHFSVGNKSLTKLREGLLAVLFNKGNRSHQDRSLFQNASASGKVTVLLINYGNSKSQLADGSCCDNLNWCISSCDNFFRLCFALTSSSDKCALWKGWTAVLGGDSFSFSKGSLGNGITNPVTYSFTHWQVRRTGSKEATSQISVKWLLE